MSFIDSFRKSLFYFLRRKTYAKTLERAQLYRLINSVELIRSYQVDRFNDIWQDAYTNIPFYKEWKLKNTLPNTISSLDELSTWPIITKKELQANYDKLKRCDVEPSGYIATGGSTGEPLKLPTWGDNETGVSMWIGRSAYGIFPDSKTFMLWGHRHLYGKGVRREVNILRQKIKDSLSNRLRVSAYDLSIDKMKENFAEYQKYKPEFVIGFSSAVLAFVRINKKCKKCTYLTPPPGSYVHSRTIDGK